MCQIINTKHFIHLTQTSPKLLTGTRLSPFHKSGDRSLGDKRLTQSLLARDRGRAKSGAQVS